MRRYRLRTIMALVAVIAVSLWCGMLIERARQPAAGKTSWVTSTGARPFTRTGKTYIVTRPVYQTVVEESKR